jgi:NADPH:quinone reductase-like Zn-dependent oxidoreductase
MTSTQSNLAWTVPAHASTVQDLEQLSLPVPVPGAGQVLVRIAAVSLNYRDLLVAMRSPEYPGAHKPNIVPCCDGAGVIHTVGPSSTWAGHEGASVVLHPNRWLTGDVRNLGTHYGDGSADVDGMYFGLSICVDLVVWRRFY